jgi:hypothetical protein
MTVFETLVPFSEALQAGQPVLVPAFAGCPACETMRMISAPALGNCAGCGAVLAVLGQDEVMRVMAGRQEEN